MNRKGIAAFLTEHAASRPVSFHMPGHKGSDIYTENGYRNFLDCIADCDITEIAGADNLFQAEGIIKETMEKYRRLYEVSDSYLLINGSSAGLIAAVMSTVSPGGRLIMARNCHKSVFNGIRMTGGEPVYAYPEVINDYGISGEITPEEIRRCIEMYPDSSAVILPSPNYYGVCSDIASISEIVHKAGMLLIVDQAHGAHLHFFDKYTDGKKRAAEHLGADIVINSTHKTLLSFTQSAVANLCSNRIDRYNFEDKLQLIESTSPSYLLMASLDINGEILARRGKELIEKWEENLQYFYKEAAKIRGLRVMAHPMLDHTKLNLDMSSLGIDGARLDHLLQKQGIFAELSTGNILMCMSGIGNKRCDYERLLEALEKISISERNCFRPICVAEGNKRKEQDVQKEPDEGDERKNGGSETGKNCSRFHAVTAKRFVQRPVPSETECIPLQEAAERVCAASIIPYPPGIPLVCPGEVIDSEVVSYVAKLRAGGEKVMGIDDMGRVIVGKERKNGIR